ncbi:hypothetical protein [Micromonospora echinofusca]|uniref:hypothetical protein n=1 Tax=Micromonospora echinofusca TaxID=47858 RepID=UPI001AD65268|nr:hypothetical protein [Micromonospora echinofusca]
MTPSEIVSLRAEALFASSVQESDSPTAERVRSAVRGSLWRYGPLGCAVLVAGEFGEHPERAVRRMAWVLRVLRAAYPELSGSTSDADAGQPLRRRRVSRHYRRRRIG